MIAKLIVHGSSRDAAISSGSAMRSTVSSSVASSPTAASTAG